MRLRRKKKNGISLRKGSAVFFREFMKRPRQVASCIPSFRFLERRILKAGDVASAETLVELGPGTGGITRAMLKAMAPDARLLSIEINPRLHRLIERIDDERLIAHLGSACDLRDCLRNYALPAPGVVVSGIPFSTMDPAEGARLTEEIAALLAPRGRFVAYQLSSRVARLCHPHLGSARTSLELFNIPPLRIYTWEKSPA